MTKFDFFCSCPLGLEAVLKEELIEINQKFQAKASPPEYLQSMNGGISWRGTLYTIMVVNLYSRIANRVLIKLKQTSYRDENDIYAATKAYPWEQWLNTSHTIRVHCQAQYTSLKSIKFITLRIKDGLCDRFRKIQGLRPSIDTLHPDVQIIAFLTGKEITLYIDTSGTALFKRGWRCEQGEAPIKENLAAGILRLIKWKPGTALFDPMCGSGTILIEAAQTILQIPPGLNRTFGFEKLLPHSKNQWQNIKKQAHNIIQNTCQLPSTQDALALIQGSDVSQKMIQITKNNLARAGVTPICLKQIDFQSIAFTMKHCSSSGIIFMNPPYGERITFQEKNKQATNYQDCNIKYHYQNNVVLKQLGDFLKKNFSGWIAFILTPNRNLPNALRLKASRKIPLFNGNFECRLFRFDLVSGSMRKVKSAIKVEYP